MPNQPGAAASARVTASRAEASSSSASRQRMAGSVVMRAKISARSEVPKTRAPSAAYSSVSAAMMSRPVWCSSSGVRSVVVCTRASPRYSSSPPGSQHTPTRSSGRPCRDHLVDQHLAVRGEGRAHDRRQHLLAGGGELGRDLLPGQRVPRGVGQVAVQVLDGLGDQARDWHATGGHPRAVAVGDRGQVVPGPPAAVPGSRPGSPAC